VTAVAPRRLRRAAPLVDLPAKPRSTFPSQRGLEIWYISDDQLGSRLLTH
jgi:hypothetical protein